MQQKKNGRTRLQSDAVRQERLESNVGKKYMHNYHCIASDLPESVIVTALTPTGEHTEIGIGLWDTGADYTTLNKYFADKLGIDPMPPMDEDGEPVAAINERYLGTATARLRIGDIQLPMDVVKIVDFDPDGQKRAAGRNIPDVLIGMDIIGQGNFKVESSTGNETILTFEL